ncbi:LCP family protein [Phytohabitans kaempferiae]|uniref:LCP family protein n=1 Tax=Phytohabitans kaempferiae TaxID=1620943 RepID=A0ABV6M8K5_9ACTN
MSEAGRRLPRWALLCTIFGTLLMVGSGGTLLASEVLQSRYEGSVTTADLFGDQADPEPEPETDIKGPLNILLAGIDPRLDNPNEPPRSDTILILHVPDAHDRAYLFSIPRDLLVDIPPFPKANFKGGRDKINAAMAYGSRVPGQEKPDSARGFELLARTLTEYTGIQRFDAGAIVNFQGFREIVDAMGGVTMTLDMDVRSEHLKPDGSGRDANPRGDGYVGVQKVYKKGTHHLKGWEALDIVRQRKTVGGDYVRQRHQQQFIKAMVNQAFSRDVVTNPVKLDNVLRAAGQSLVFNGRGHSVLDYAVALRDIRSNSITMIKLPGRGVGTGSNYRGEELLPPAADFFAAVRNGTVDSFVVSHPEFINK